ncbi:hypothetical protein M8997_021245 [Phyllobacterium sp. 21LDTY02-6]|jgi:hypothetical protein|uniref:hypothetical protein n=1 Tax=unclassified Phyllobacterium TaxID=2638441 RepID=UPI0020215A3B|nr:MULTISPECIES: hypothetical protein [unclassified Phyllobacterium]MCO4319717.1 hypothetical protein [Phyllobacterium sp. 21LDTY02-6]MCX8280459.1 hypothetical protein [Phyllobacterium sp. 0TCS1.6C]MCX8295092.1 hypothetical protein [Phyllobacterium sp. 0TCS1.6A]
MQHDEAGTGRKPALKEGDTVEVLRARREDRPGSPQSDNWVKAKVVANSDDCLTVSYGEGEPEVIPWKSGRIKGHEH